MLVVEPSTDPQPEASTLEHEEAGPRPAMERCASRCFLVTCFVGMVLGSSAAILCENTKKDRIRSNVLTI